MQAPGIDQGQLRRAVTDRAGVSPPLTRTDGALAGRRSRARDARLSACAGDGANRFPNGNSHTALVFDLDVGTRATIGTITVNGPDDARLRAAGPAADRPAARRIERDALNARIAKYLDDRRSHRAITKRR